MTEVHRCASLDEALEARARYPWARVLAGGTALSRAITRGERPELLLDLGALDELRSIGRERTHSRAGAMTTLADVLESPLLARRVPMFVEACACTRSPQLRRRATLGGVIAQADPRSPLLPALLALDAKVELRSAANGSRSVPVAVLVDRRRSTRLRSDELITGLELPHPLVGDETGLMTVGTPTPELTLALRIQVIDGQVEQARVALGGLTPVPQRCKAVEHQLEGHRIQSQLSEHLLDDLDEALAGTWRARAAVNLLRTLLDSLG